MTGPGLKRIVVVYNQPLDELEAQDSDTISEAGVKVEAEHVCAALTARGFSPELLAVSEIGHTLREIERLQPDLLFNLCEGFQGNAHHEMHLAGLWELLHVPYTGNSALTLGLAQNKVLTKQVLVSNNIPTPRSMVCTSAPEHTELEFPLIVKPAAEDASLGISPHSVVSGLEELQDNVRRIVQKYKQAALVEQYIPGREFNVGVYGPLPGMALPVSEIQFNDFEDKTPRITSYEAKWLTDHPLYARTPSYCPARIDAALQEELQSIALRTYQVLSGRDYGRIDFRVTAEKAIYVLEYNPNPDISRDAGFAKALSAANFDYSEFIESLCHHAFNRGQS